MPLVDPSSEQDVHDLRQKRGLAAAADTFENDYLSGINLLQATRQDISGNPALNLSADPEMIIACQVWLPG
jgi:hypothetical protein